MKKPVTQIKNIIESHLWVGMCGGDIWGRHEQAVIDGKNGIILIDAFQPSRFEDAFYIIYHPDHGKWMGSLTVSSDKKRAHVRGAPKQVATSEQLRSWLAEANSEPVIHRVYGVSVNMDKGLPAYDKCLDKFNV